MYKVRLRREQGWLREFAYSSSACSSSRQKAIRSTTSLTVSGLYVPIQRAVNFATVIVERIEQTASQGDLHAALELRPQALRRLPGQMVAVVGVEGNGIHAVFVTGVDRRNAHLGKARLRDLAPGRVRRPPLVPVAARLQSPSLLQLGCSRPRGACTAAMAGRGSSAAPAGTGSARRVTVGEPTVRVAPSSHKDADGTFTYPHQIP